MGKLTAEMIAEKLNIIIYEYEKCGSKVAAFKKAGINSTYYTKWCEMYPLFRARMEELEKEWAIKSEEVRLKRLKEKKDKLLCYARDVRMVKESLSKCGISGTEINDWVENDYEFKRQWFEIFPLLDYEKRKEVFLREFEETGRISVAVEKTGGSVNWYMDLAKSDSNFGERFEQICIKCAEEGRLGRRWPNIVIGLFKEVQKKFMDRFVDEYKSGDRTIIECICKVGWSEAGYYYAYKTVIGFKVIVDQIHRMRLEYGVTKETAALMNGVSEVEKKRRQKLFLRELYRVGNMNEVDWSVCAPLVEAEAYEMRKIDPAFKFQWMRVVLLCRIEGRLPEKGRWNVFDGWIEFVDVKIRDVEFSVHSIARYFSRVYVNYVMNGDDLLKDIDFVQRMCVRIWKTSFSMVIGKNGNGLKTKIKSGMVMDYDQVMKMFLQDDDFSKEKEMARRKNFWYVYDGLGIWVVEKTGTVVTYLNVDNGDDFMSE